MDAIRCSSKIPLNSIFPLLRSLGACATIIDPSAVFSIKQLELAEALAKKSMDDKTSVSDRMEVEFLLWLACTPNIKRAVELVGAKRNDDFIFVVLDGKANARKMAKKLGLEEIKKPIGSNDALFLFGVKSKDELFEKMALSRI